MALLMSGADSYVLFEVAGTTYALRSDDILQLEMIGRITPVPNAPAFVEGVASVRGQVIPVLSLRARFGLAPAPHDVRSRMIVVRVGERTVGLLADSAREFATIPGETIIPPPQGVTGTSGPYLRGLAQLGERLVLVLDVAELLDARVHPMLPGGEHAPAGE